MLDELESFGWYMLSQCQNEIKDRHGNKAFLNLTLAADERHGFTVKAYDSRLGYSRMPNITCDILKQILAIVHNVLSVDIEALRMVNEHLVDECAVFFACWQSCLDCRQNVVLPYSP